MTSKINIFNQLLGFTLFLFLFSCSSDLDVVKKTEIESERLITSHKDFEFVKSNKTIYNIITNSGIAKYAKSKSNILQSKDFKIFTNYVTYKTHIDKSRESYTFYIERNNAIKSNSIENLILAKDPNNKNYRAYIATYFFPDGIYSQHNNFKLISFKEINSQTLLPTNLISKTSCIDTYTYIITETGHNCYSGEHNGAGQAGSCSGGAKPYSTYSIEVLTHPCGGASDAGASDLGGGSSDGGGTGDGSTSSGPNILPVDTGMTLASPCRTNDCSEMAVVNEINDLLGQSLDYKQIEWLSWNISAANEIKTFLVQNNTTDAKAFINYMINYSNANPDVTWSQIQNWFLGASEGTDGDYDAAFWENPNLTFQKQNLPSYNDYVNGMARFDNGTLMKGADNIYGLVGGKVQQARITDKASTENTCALKVSIALNRSGVVIPNLPGKTIEGGGEFSGKYFFLNAKSLNSWMRKTFGTNPASSTTPYNANHLSYKGIQGGTNGVNFPDLLKGKKAIYSMITTNQYSTSTRVSGHADLLFPDSNNFGNCAFGCFFNLPIERIDIWILN